MALGVLVALIFVVSTVAMFLLYALIQRGTKETLRERVDTRLQEMTGAVEIDSDSLVKTAVAGPLPAVDRMVTDTESGSALGRWIEQSGLAVTPSGLLIASAVSAVLVGGIARVLAGPPWPSCPEALSASPSRLSSCGAGAPRGCIGSKSTFPRRSTSFPGRCARATPSPPASR
jgi:Flp pilus assembly protein TadB